MPFDLYVGFFQYASEMTSNDHSYDSLVMRININHPLCHFQSVLQFFFKNKISSILNKSARLPFYFLYAYENEFSLE
jgi:hypothetical protein